MNLRGALAWRKDILGASFVSPDIHFCFILRSQNPIMLAMARN
jgi:hypothetical protein